MTSKDAFFSTHSVFYNSFLYFARLEVKILMIQNFILFSSFLKLNIINKDDNIRKSKALNSEGR